MAAAAKPGDIAHAPGSIALTGLNPRVCRQDGDGQLKDGGGGGGVQSRFGSTPRKWVAPAGASDTAPSVRAGTSTADELTGVYVTLTLRGSAGPGSGGRCGCCGRAACARHVAAL
eukprot:359802-Chlamydomonas_euryale.AAC.16